ncbi:hypothetical protein CFOL_v3_18537, partial [Cephalotus follicularis]
MEEHLKHLRITLEILKQHSLVAKRSKCIFGGSKVEYLGHFISEQGVSTDPKKVATVQQWPIPKNLKELRGFLGLTGYYKRFIRNYSLLSKPLTSLLKKDAFKWTDEATDSFNRLKDAMVTAPILALPDMQEEFVVETDASGSGIGAVLMQNGHPVAYISKQLSPKHQALSVYEKELFAILFAVKKCEHYLLCGHFKIKTDHQSLKYLLQQKLTTPGQVTWLSKLLRFDYEIVYKKGKENIAADALSRIEGKELFSLFISSTEYGLLEEIQCSWQQDDKLIKLIKQLQSNPETHTRYTWKDDLLKKDGKLVV